MKQAIENFTPSNLCCSIPWEDASRASRLTFACLRSARHLCKLIGSSVVRSEKSLSGLSKELHYKPRVPNAADLNPINSHIWFKKWQTEVLPFVPVIAIILSGCSEW